MKNTYLFTTTNHSPTRHPLGIVVYSAHSIPVFVKNVYVRVFMGTGDPFNPGIKLNPYFTRTSSSGGPTQTNSFKSEVVWFG
jgi:hypothetical protein